MRRLNYHTINAQEWQDHFRNFRPFVVEEVVLDSRIQAQSLISFLQQDNTIIDVSCVGKDEIEYKGNPSDRESIKLPIKSFIEGFVRMNEGRHHWLQESGLNFYLGQSCLYSPEPSAIQISLPSVNELRPEMIKDSVIDAVNLWMNCEASQSTLHYDANHNLLLVLQGAKTVYLLSPDLTDLIQPKSIFSETPNHSRCSFAEVSALIGDLRRKSEFEGKCFMETVRAGEAIFIPEGWWHQVESIAFTIGLNYWFSSGLQSFDAANKMSHYLLRKLSHSLIMQQAKDSYQKELKSRVNNRIYVNLSLDAFIAVIEQSLRSINESEKQQKQLDVIFCDYDAMKTFWLPYSNQNGSKWTEFLLQLTQKSAYILLELWDEIEKDPESAEFFEQIFLSCGNQSVEVRQYLISQRDAWMRSIGERYLHDLLGI